jgi:hypothetical protein
VNAPPQPARADVIEAILAASQRPTNTVPLRWSFVQNRVGATSRPGPLSRLVTRGRDSALEQFLLAHALASGEGFGVQLPAVVWARALGLSEDAADCRTVGRNWAILRDLRLVSTERVGRLIKATMLDEGGSGEPYHHPGEAPHRSRYMQLPFAYWRDGHHVRLNVPGKAVLLIALTHGDWFSLPTRQGPSWYGLGRSTLERGFANAQAAEILERQKRYKAAPLTPTGWTLECYHRLRPPFGPVGRIAKSAHADFQAPAEEASPALQRDTSPSTGKRRTPAAGTPKTGGKTRKAGARRSSRPRSPTTPV